MLNVNFYDITDSSYFTLDSSFVRDLQSLSNVDLGKAVPFISLKTLKFDGSGLEDLNVTFTKPIDFDNIKSSTLRYPERPLISIKSLELKTDAASGYLYYTSVTLVVKIHSPYMLTSSSLLGLLIPNTPILLQYGWNGPTENILIEKETLLFSVISYNLSIDVAGQIEVTVNGMAFNEQFGSVLIGDESPNPEDLTVKNYPCTAGAGTVSDKIQKLQDTLDLLNKIVSQKTPIQDYETVKNAAEQYSRTIERAKGLIAKKCSQNFQSVEKLFKSNRVQISILSSNKKVSILDGITFHDLFKTLCVKTLNNMSGLMIGAKEIKVSYGQFNENCGTYAGKSIGDFPIEHDRFLQIISKEIGKGKDSITINNFLNLIAQEFLDNNQYWKDLLSKTKTKDFTMPHIVFNFHNFSDKNKNQILELQILDINRDIPNTTGLMPNGPGSADVVEKKLPQGFPIIRLGNANSFIKNVNLTQILDEQMKAVLISRRQQDTVDFYGKFSTDSSILSTATNPLILPLQGSMEVVGHPKWKPFKSFYLDAGIFLVNGIYKILAVSHRLSHQGYSTNIEFMYH